MRFWVRLQVPATKQFNGLPNGEPFVFDGRENNPKVAFKSLI
jgi:hypothetical protein